MIKCGQNILLAFRVPFIYIRIRKKFSFLFLNLLSVSYVNNDVFHLFLNGPFHLKKNGCPGSWLQVTSPQRPGIPLLLRSGNNTGKVMRCPIKKKILLSLRRKPILRGLLPYSSHTREKTTRNLQGSTYETDIRDLTDLDSNPGPKDW